MGIVSFQLPSGLSPDVERELAKAYIAGGPDNMPWPGEVRVASGQLAIVRMIDESGYLAVPWDIEDIGRLMANTATLMPRALPYQFLLELARGKVNQVRCQAADWVAGGLEIPAAFSQRIRESSRVFGQAVTNEATAGSDPQAQAALALGYGTAYQLIQLYMEQVFRIRHQRQPRLDTNLGCLLGCAVPQGEGAAGLLLACNSVSLHLAWNEVEHTSTEYDWQASDDVLAWAELQGLTVSAGPLIDFASEQLPSWLWQKDRDLAGLAELMCSYAEAAVKRYKGRIHRWQLTAAGNCAAIAALDEDELMWLTIRLADTVRQVDPNLELVVGVAQPWGEYLTGPNRLHSPFIFADTLIRTGLNLAALDLELVMGVSPRGSYCRDPLETSRLLDLYALLGLPLQVTLGYPSSCEPDPAADPDFAAEGGHWREGYTARAQADWAASFAALALCKPNVHGIRWAHFADAEPHLFPHCGLIDARSAVKPALEQLSRIRTEHLR